MTNLMHNKCYYAAIYLVTIGLFFLPLSIALTNIVIIGAFFALFAGQWSLRRQAIWHFYFMRLTLLFLIVITASLLFKLHDHPMARLSTWHMYTYKAALSFFCIFPLFFNHHHRRTSVYAFIVACCLCALYITLNRTHPLYLTNPIMFSIIVIVAAYLGLLQITEIKTNWKRWLLIVITFCLFAFIFLVNKERTSMVCAAALLFIFALQSGSLKWGGITLTITTACLFAFYFSSARLQQRVNIALSQGQAYMTSIQENKTPSFAAMRTSIGQRLYILDTGIQLWKKHPFFGYGTGGLPLAYQSLHDPYFIKLHRENIGDPDNGYLFILLNWGGVGLALFLLCFLAQYIEANQLPPFERKAVRGLIINILIASITSSAFIKYLPCFATLLLSGIFFSAYRGNPLLMREKQEKNNKPTATNTSY